MRWDEMEVVGRDESGVKVGCGDGQTGNGRMG